MVIFSKPTKSLCKFYKIRRGFLCILSVLYGETTVFDAKPSCPQCFNLEFSGQWEVQPNKRCHSEPVRTLAWESPSFKGEPAEKVTPYLWGLPHHSAEWFAMTVLTKGIATPFCGMVRNDTLLRDRHLPDKLQFSKQKTACFRTLFLFSYSALGLR